MKSNSLKKSLYILGAVGIVSFGFGACENMASAVDATTKITATIDSTLVCSGGTATIDTITPGSSKTGTATLSVTTNSPAGFTVSVKTLNALTNSSASTSNTLAYNPEAKNGTAGWYAVPATASEWTLTSGKITATSVKTHNGSSATAVTDTITVTVGTADTTPSGTYTNDNAIVWTCAAK